MGGDNLQRGFEFQCFQNFKCWRRYIISVTKLFYFAYSAAKIVEAGIVIKKGVEFWLAAIFCCSN